jgi:chromosomal replication initiation ATPase DnaA
MYQLADPTNREMISKIQQKLTKESQRSIIFENDPRTYDRFMQDVIDIVKEEADDFLGLEFSPLFSTKIRKRQVVVMRQVAMFIIRKHAPFIILETVAKYVGGKNHATILHSVRQVSNLIEVKDFEYFLFTKACIEKVAEKWEVKIINQKFASTLKKYL